MRIDSCDNCAPTPRRCSTSIMRRSLGSSATPTARSPHSAPHMVSYINPAGPAAEILVWPLRSMHTRSSHSQPRRARRVLCPVRWSWPCMPSQSASKDNGTSRIPNFFRMTIRERLDALHERMLLSDDDIALLAAGDHTLRIQTADKMIENVVGVLGLPLGLALNFLI